MYYQELDSIFIKIFEYENSIPLDQKIGWHGVINDLFVRKNPLMHHDLLPAVKRLCDSAEFCQHVINIRRNYLIIERRIFLKKIRNERSDTFSIANVRHINKELFISDFNQLLEKFDNEFTNFGYEWMYKNHYESIHGSFDGFTEIIQNYGFYRVCSYLYDNYCDRLQERKEIINDNSFIHEYFLGLGSDAAKKPSFERYGLITLNDDFEIYNSKEICCLQYKGDSEHHYLYLNIDKSVFSELIKLWELGQIGSLAFKIIDIKKFVPCLEDMERGKCFTLNLYNLPNISMLYDGANYEDRLYIKYSERDCSLTFEELDDNFKIVDEYIRTQVIHMQFVKNNEEYYICHLDHEYIYYTPDEYENRRTNPEQKGKKIKTFKIDNACIPITYKPNGIFFLYFILDNYLEHKKLLREYFSGTV